MTARRRSEQLLREEKEAAELANRSKSEFVANMSYELRTSMNGILGMTRLALETELSDAQREYSASTWSWWTARLGLCSA